MKLTDYVKIWGGNPVGQAVIAAIVTVLLVLGFGALTLYNWFMDLPQENVSLFGVIMVFGAPGMFWLGWSIRAIEINGWKNGLNSSLDTIHEAVAVMKVATPSRSRAGAVQIIEAQAPMIGNMPEYTGIQEM